MPVISSGKDNVSAGTPPPVKKQNKDGDKHFSFISDEPVWHLDDLVLSPETREKLTDAITFCVKKATIVDSWGLKSFLKGSSGCTGINMYGKPGTGKTIGAEAIATATGKRIIKVDYSEIQSEKWGGTEKQLTELFETALSTGSIIFFDEADGLLGKRKSDGANAETNNQIKSHLLTLLDRYDVIVVFATNLFENYDRAFFRRILFHISFPLPNEEQLVDLWKLHLGDEPNEKRTSIVPRSKTFSFEQLAKDSIGLSGGDVKNLTLQACIHLVAKDEPALTNDMVARLIATYRQSLQDMDHRQDIKTEVLTGKEKEQADKLLNK